ncbi:MAG: hypothetical protein A2Y77_03830 [Planctomycetes bacterium RBG_13_62_9]|nr:MAG: hypothetical protein A2Y77_03830 [Planctomycetes bacterium RBG_13_62_9]
MASPEFHMRKDSGELRLAITVSFAILSGGFLYVGYLLTRAGASGEWTIVSTFKGWTLYITSISPGLFVMILGVVILRGLPGVFKSLEHMAPHRT